MNGKQQFVSLRLGVDFSNNYKTNESISIGFKNVLYLHKI